VLEFVRALRMQEGAPGVRLYHRAIRVRVRCVSARRAPRPVSLQLLLSGLYAVAFFAYMLDTSHAQGKATCADFPNEFPTPNPNKQPINHPDAAKPDDPNSKAVKAAQAKKEQYLKCSPALLSPLEKATSPAKEPFDQLVAQAVKAKKDRTAVAKAVYIVQLASKGTIEKTDFGDDPAWWKIKYVEWCAANDPGGTKKLPLPKPKTLVQSVAELDTKAIPLGWGRVERVDGERLPNSCDDSLLALVKRVGAAK
jgi:hypothetical protein